MAAVTITIERDLTKVTDRELLQMYVYASELHDSLAPNAPQPPCITALWDEMRFRGYRSPMLCDVKAALR